MGTADDSQAPPPPLLLREIPLSDQGWLHVRGLLELRSPELGPQSVVFNPRTGQDLTQEDIERLRVKPSAAELRMDGHAPRRARAPTESAAFMELLSFNPKARDYVATGPLPAGDYSGSLRGPSLATEGVGVLKPGAARLDINVSAANYFNNEDAGQNGFVRQKFETHTVALQARFGLQTARPVEVGVEARLQKQNRGFLNGFIDEIEHGASAMFGNPDLVNPDRSGPTAMTGVVNLVRLGKQVIQQGDVSRAEAGDLTFIIKATLNETDIGSFVPALAARLALTVATGGRFSSVSSVAAGLSAQESLSRKLYIHGDLRAIKPIAQKDPNQPPLKSGAIGGTVGFEYFVTPKTSIGAQVDVQSSPYKKTGVHAFDDVYSDVTFGISHLAEFASRKVLIRLYGKEDFNVNPTSRGRLAPHGDSDFKAGISVSIPFN